MGMFDYLQWHGPLPKGMKRSRVLQNCNPFQTKSLRLWETDQWRKEAYESGCVTATVAEDGTLADPAGTLIPLDGDVVFYGSGVGVRFTTFRATFAGGRVRHIEVQG